MCFPLSLSNISYIPYQKAGKWINGWIVKPLILRVILFGSDIIIFIFILVFSNFLKNPYYSYGWETKQCIFKRRLKQNKIHVSGGKYK